MRSTETGGGFSLDVLTILPGQITFRAAGTGATQAFEKEAGGHRWQGVSPTEKRGRVHSSTVTVAVLREPEQNEVVLKPGDLRIETYRAPGPGGQHRNTSDTAVRITHLPTRVQASSALKSQHRNRELALAELRARLFHHSEHASSIAQNSRRRKQVGTGMRADKIRTVAEQRQRVENHTNGRRMPIHRYLKGYIEEIH